MNIIAWLDFEYVDFKAAVQHISTRLRIIKIIENIGQKYLNQNKVCLFLLPKIAETIKNFE